MLALFHSRPYLSIVQRYMASEEMAKEMIFREMVPGTTLFCRILSKGTGVTVLRFKSTRLHLAHINSVDK
jgi:hypothetical protein